ACIGRAGLNRKTAYATLAAVLAAEAADIDILWSLAGPVEELKHHRGITHTFLGAPFVAGAAVGVVWLWNYWRERRRSRKANEADTGTNEPAAAGRQKIRWGLLYLTALIAALSHLLLDWTNNYGLRPFFPFNPRWYAGNLVFIVEPVFYGLFFVALVLPWLLGLADSEIGVRRKPFRGRGWAIFALTGMVVLWCVRWAEQAQARAMVENLQLTTEPVTRMALEPYMVNPFRWHLILETADYYQTGEIDTRSGEITSDPVRDTIYKPADTPAVEAAKQTLLGQVYLDWGRWAVVRDVGPEPVAALAPPDLPPGRTWTTVEFSDLRFAYSFLGTARAAGRSPLSGWAYIVDNREDAGEGMGGQVQK
ncbi:MAG TPA: metal-dependent hydrolase, partial [Terracidiphilus sp.]|nr:metal-dependent hydrolase [Terracidiphilus sp.]